MPTPTTARILLPGEEVPIEALPASKAKNGALKLGPGLAHEPPSTIRAVLAGSLSADSKKNAVWISSNRGRQLLIREKYIPQFNDVVLATVHHSAADYFFLTLTPYTSHALLPHLAFENASKKTRPQFAAGALVYCRIASSQAHNKFQEPELTCVNPATGKADGLGELKGGMVFSISLSMAARLLLKKQRQDGGIAVLEVLAKKWPFEVAVGRNGYIWVEAGDVKRTLLIGRVLTATDEEKLTIEAQEKLVKKLSKELGVE